MINMTDYFEKNILAQMMVEEIAKEVSTTPANIIADFQKFSDEIDRVMVEESLTEDEATAKVVSTWQFPVLQ